MAGPNPVFPADEVRAALRFAMVMGTPQAAELRTKFRWHEQKTFQRAGPDGRRPYRFDDEPVATATIPELELTCCTIQGAHGLTAPDTAGTAAGTFDSEKLTVLLLDDEYADLVAHGDGRLPDLIVASGDTYEHVTEGAVLPLFDMTAHVLYATSADV